LVGLEGILKKIPVWFSKPGAGGWVKVFQALKDPPKTQRPSSLKVVLA
jgi:hypothetical protein